MKKHKPAPKTVEEIADYMSSPVLSIDGDKTIRETAQYMNDHKVGSLVVTQKNDPVGIVTETDLTRKVLAKGLDSGTAKVRKIMSTPLVTIDCHDSIVDANQMMAKKKIRHLAVTENGKVVGMISVKDLVHYYSNPRMRSW